jgi:dTDP-4-dehydrorhamnose 3,5-epimerase-like enzyme
MEIKKIQFPTYQNETGTLSFFEAERHIPFDIRRVYYIYDVQGNSRRGFHAHRALEQVLLCIHGSCKILLDNGKEQETVLLDKPNEGLIVENPIWREMYDFSPGAVLLVMASQYYDEADYIRDYDEFLAYMKENEV